jgi:GntR family transcriptional regulator
VSSEPLTAHALWSAPDHPGTQSRARRSPTDGRVPVSPVAGLTDHPYVGPMAPRIDRRSPVPLWAQVLEDLRGQVASGAIVGRFPTDAELMERYGVSRHTVRDAVNRLLQEGLLDRQRGRGTFVRSTAIEQPLGALYSLFRSIEDQGFEQRSVVRALERRTDAEAAAVLGLGARSALVFLERLRLADDEPVALDCSWLPADVAGPLLGVDFERTSLYQQLAARCGVSPTRGSERIRPELPTPEQRRVLEVAARQPVFAIERVAFAGDRPLEWRHSVVRGDRYAFIARWEGRDEVHGGLEADTPARSSGS